MDSSDVHGQVTVPNHDSVSSLPSPTGFLHKFRKATRRPRSRNSHAKVEDMNSSEDSQVLYMAQQKPSHRNRRSLSNMSNMSERRHDGSSEAMEKSEPNSEAELRSWSVIDREIHEWQTVCRTGRPYWWSIRDKSTRFTKRVLLPDKPRIFAYEAEDALPFYENRRRAVSDSYLADPNTVHDMASIIAIQLLGACFTLPPDSMETNSHTPTHNTRFTKGFNDSPDPRMISALRLHTYFRHSPCFGHQPRNTSPERNWGSGNGGPSLASPSSYDSTGFRTPNNATFDEVHYPRKDYRAPNPSADRQASLEEQNVDSLQGSGWNEEIWDNSKPSHIKRLMTAPAEQREHPEIISPDPLRSTSSQKPHQRNYTLQPVIRSEPHHVFIQPVKELVVKRWKSIRRQFGGSLHSPLPNKSDQISPGPSTGASSPRNSLEGISRRRRAQERGDIHSSSVESSPRYNTPNSENRSPAEAIGPARTARDRANLLLPQPDPIVAASALLAAEMKKSTSTPNSSAPDQSPAPGRASHTKTESGFFAQTSPATAPVFSPRAGRSRKQRRSMLSEVCTPNDFDDMGQPVDETTGSRNALSVPGSAIASPSSELGPTSTRSISMSHIAESSNSGRSEVSDGFPTDVAYQLLRRPRVGRVSTSGTEIFKPAEEGIEVDGKPVGPGEDTWNSSIDKNGTRRERSFL